MSIKVIISDLYSEENQTPFLPDESQLNNWYHEVAQRLGDEDFIVSVAYVDPEHMRELNNQYRGKDYATNILSFGYTEAAGASAEDIYAESAEILGDLVICPPVLERESQEQEKPLEHHWAHICIHGLLHLLGYDHIKPDEALEMEGKEKELLEQLGIPDPYRDDEDENLATQVRESLE